MFRDRWGSLSGILLAAVLCAPQAAGQTYVRDYSSVLFFNGPRAYTEPLSGGINAPMQQFIDADADGDLDLYIFDNDYYTARYFFRNEGTARVPLFVLDPDDGFYDVPFTFWFLFDDYDSDGMLELLTDDGSRGVFVWTNVNTPADPVWQSSMLPLRDTSGNEVFAGFASLPGIVDLDGDTLREFLSSNSADGSFNYYRNTGSRGDPRYALVSNSFENITILGDTCYSAPSRSTGLSKALHGAGAIAFADLESDGARDLFYGDIFSHSLFRIANIGTPATPDLECVANFYPPDGTLSTVGFNQASFTDIDGDGDMDLLVGVLNSRSTNSFWYFENRGTPFTPAFHLTTTDFLSTLDVGQNAHPAAVDFDRDGDQDLVIGNTSGRLWYFRNDGSVSIPLYTLADTMFMGISGDYSYAPAFTDLNADSLPDLLLGRFDGRIMIYLNTGGALVPADSLFSAQFAVPAAGDIDGDGDPDLVVGTGDGTLAYYRNDGDPTHFVPVPVPGFFADIDVGENARPVLVRNDTTSLLDLYVTPASDGSPERANSRIFYYVNAGTPGAPAFTLSDDRWGPAVPPEPALVFSDLDGDGDRDLLVGTSKGGLWFYRNDPLTAVRGEGEIPADYGLEQNFPNPFNGGTVIRYSMRRTGYVRLEVFTLEGELLEVLHDGMVTQGHHEVSFTPGSLPTGVYFVRMTTDAGAGRMKMIYLK